MQSAKSRGNGQPTVYFLPEGKRIGLERTETILQASLKAGISHAHACGGKARCSTCRVVILEGLEYCLPRNAKEKTLAGKLKFSPEIRLACQTRIAGPVRLRRPVLDNLDLELASLMKNKAGMEHVGSEKKIAILFSDICDFTPFVEELPPYDVVHILNRYFHLMGQVVAQHHGQISDYVGDGMLVLFGVDNPEEAALQAVRAGVAMFNAVEKLNPYLQTMYGRRFSIRIGIHFGEVVLGSIGIGDQRKLAVFGDAVNLASRIEMVNKETGTHFLISEETFENVADQVRLKNMYTRQLKGKRGIYKLYEIDGIA